MNYKEEWEKAYALISDAQYVMARHRLPKDLQDVFTSLLDYVVAFDIEDHKPVQRRKNE